jgi:hypothetical protein
MVAMDAGSNNKGGDGAFLKSAEMGWLNLGGVHADISDQYNKAPKFDFASAAAGAKYLNSGSVEANGSITFSPQAKAHADNVISSV